MGNAVHKRTFMKNAVHSLHMVWRISLLAVLVVTTVAGCEIDCRTPTVKYALKHEDIVFRGTITEIGTARVTFTIQRVWKGALTEVLSMPKIVHAAPCQPGFSEEQLQVGNELVVYAHWWWDKTNQFPSWAPPGSLPGYVVSICTRTALSRDASGDVKKLGPGKSPYPRNSDSVGLAIEPVKAAHKKE
jgi:hypothetical protein